jgi:hypothetical protein
MGLFREMVEAMFRSLGIWELMSDGKTGSAAIKWAGGGGRVAPFERESSGGGGSDKLPPSGAEPTIAHLNGLLHPGIIVREIRITFRDPQCIDICIKSLFLLPHIDIHPMALS